MTQQMKAEQSTSAKLNDALETTQTESKTIARLLGEVVGDAQHLIRKELELAQYEIKSEINRAVKGITSLGVGAGITLLGGFLLLFTLVYLLADIFVLDLWLSFLIVGGVVFLIGAILLAWGASQMRKLDPTPHQTIENARKDVQWIKEQQPSSKT
jgi:uncharacterized membrane protein YqjE